MAIRKSELTLILWASCKEHGLEREIGTSPKDRQRKYFLAEGDPS